MSAISNSRYAEVHARSLRDPEGFWAEAAREIDWIEPAKKVFDPSIGLYGRWFAGAVDRTTVHEIGSDQPAEEGWALHSALSGLGEAQQQKGDQGHRDLDTHGILRGADEAGDLEGLLDPAEEQLDGPASAIELGNVLCAGIEVI